MAQGTSHSAEGLMSTATRRAYVVERRMGGDTWQEVADATAERYGLEHLPSGWSRRYAHMDFMRELERRQEESAESAEQLRDLQQMRLEKLMRGLWNAAVRGDEKAVDRALGIMKRQAKLFGLDEPERFEQTVSMLNTEAYEALRSAVMNALEPYPEARAAVADALTETPVP